jgi:hypothetical protein
MRATELEGKRFGRLVCTTRMGDGYRCLCDCGVSKWVRTDKLKDGTTKSCGCLGRELNAAAHADRLARKKAAEALKPKPRTTAQKRLAAVHQSMLQRCYNTTYSDYRFYGARGVTVCDSWQKSVGEFIVWAELNGYRSGLWLERVNNTQGYSPDNCRWASPKAQAQNRCNTLYLLHPTGVKVPMVVWVRNSNRARKGAKLTYMQAFNAYKRLQTKNPGVLPAAADFSAEAYADESPLSVFWVATNNLLTTPDWLPDTIES